MTRNQSFLCKSLLSGAALTGLFTLTPAALAHHSDGDSRTDFRVNIHLGQAAPRYEEHTTRVWVEPVYRTECERVWIEPAYRDDCQRVWIPDRWERREVVRYRGCRRWVSCEDVLVEPGHWDVRNRQILVCEGHWETRERQVLVTPCHWEYRTERVQVDDRCYPNPWFGVFASLSR